ncbi:hypothetical protein CC85DRAFT_283370 [Cutaneotrichosporon oleaginosum]|uniref:Protein kinase domain-containing protein n=1 Tax=Cutaneotrichosporon oleaginosum TaxID=879819 RepID=A0A0J0XUL1_9TREE|nr:uncharacterized protein CC85DRAFT_283370 [Cutaneotrichosporon oleaginosum]KLT44737.1 hypothetical protein CC85DRAFT_283370 [Cutaneotrichosporon oleaginosum]TXT07723.1 hypothetical protein COLE_04647 [Cutaneotrichosporon oleaginosum]
MSTAFDIVAGPTFRPGRRAELERGRPYVFEPLVAPSSSAKLTLLTLRGQGRSYDVYHAMLGNTPVVAKICDPWLAAGEQQLDRRRNGSASANGATNEEGEEEDDDADAAVPDRRAAMEREARLYTALQGLQGSVVPRFYGLWRGTCPSKSPYRPDYELLVMAVEDVGESLQAKVRDWAQAKEYADAIRAAYDKLHTAGIVHNDVNLCNIMVSGPRLSLVDFEGALRTGEAEFEDALKAEQGMLAQVTA